METKTFFSLSSILSCPVARVFFLRFFSLSLPDVSAIQSPCVLSFFFLRLTDFVNLQPRVRGRRIDSVVPIGMLSMLMKCSENFDSKLAAPSPVSLLLFFFFFALSLLLLPFS